MEDKDPKDEELNPQGQDDINDADDSFGLPEMDYKTLDEAADNDSSVKVEEQNEDSVVNEEHHDEEYNYSSDTTEDTEKQELRFQLEEEKSNTPKILIGIFAVIIVAVSIWFLGFYRPHQQKLERDAKAKQDLLDKQKADAAAALKREQEEAAAAQAEEQRLREEAEALAKAGVVKITERTGRYYIILESFVDADFAKDYGDRVAKAGTPSYLIPPYSKKKMQRVGIGAYATIGEAESALSNLPESFGKGKWILKY